VLFQDGQWAAVRLVKLVCLGFLLRASRVFVLDGASIGRGREPHHAPDDLRHIASAIGRDIAVHAV
jgi:hypothetical protein